jgi:hypothetical protein
MNRYALLVFACAALLCFTDASEAAKRKGAGGLSTVVGCVEQGVTGSCLILGERGTGESYDITSARPRPRIGRAIRARGEVRDVITTCQQGPVIARMSFRYVGGRCPRR